MYRKYNTFPLRVDAAHRVMRFLKRSPLSRPVLRGFCKVPDNPGRVGPHSLFLVFAAN